MVKNNVKKVIVCLLMILMVVFAVNKSFATDASDSDTLNKLFKGENTNYSNENANEIENGINNNALNQNNNPAKNNNLENSNIKNNSNENKPTTAPDTGIENYSSIVFVVIFVVSAIYAYKKIKEYNV